MSAPGGFHRDAAVMRKSSAPRTRWEQLYRVLRRVGSCEGWSEVRVEGSHMPAGATACPGWTVVLGGPPWWRTTGGRPGRWCFECEKRPFLAERFRLSF